MRKILEVSTDHIDETENVQSVDVYFVDDDGEEGTVACEVCLDTGKVFYRDNLYRGLKEIKTAIEEIRKTIVKKIPKIVVTISGGCLQLVNSSEEVEVAMIDFDTQGTDEEQLKQIPYSVTDNRMEPAIANEYELDIIVDEERINQLFKIIKG